MPLVAKRCQLFVVSRPLCKKQSALGVERQEKFDEFSLTRHIVGIKCN
jgi:hypothetical protein